MKTLLFLFFITVNISSQSIDSLTFSRLSQELLQKHPALNLNKSLINEGFFIKNNCVYEKDSDYIHICVKNHWKKHWVSDLNNDTINDIIIKTTESVVASQKNFFNILTLNKDLEIIKNHHLYSAGLQGSGYGALKIDSLKNQYIYTSLYNNYLYEIGDQRDKPINLVFYIKNNRLEERQYSKCKLYQKDKSIFKKNKLVNESYSFDKYYNTKKTETLNLKQNHIYKGSFSGCNKPELNFSYSIKNRKIMEANSSVVKKQLLDYISFLSENTKFELLFSELTSIIEKKTIDISDFSITEIETNLKNNRKAKIWISFVQHFDYYISIKISPVKNNDLSYWDNVKNKFKN